MTTIAKKTTKDPVIVVLQLSGGNDYLNTIVPYNSSEYRDYRPIVNVEENGAGYVVHVFPSCDFANETMSGIAPDLLARVAEIEHMVIIIATCN